MQFSQINKKKASVVRHFEFSVNTFSLYSVKLLDPLKELQKSHKKI
jgi:hypothetical protein